MCINPNEKQFRYATGFESATISYTNTQQFSQTGQTIKLCCEYLPIRSIWRYVLIMWYTHFRVNLHSIVAWMSRNSLLGRGAIYDVLMTATGFENFNNFPVIFADRDCCQRCIVNYSQISSLHQKMVNSSRFLTVNLKR